MSEAWIGLIGSIIVGLLSLVGVIYNGKSTRDVMMEQLIAHSDQSDAKLEKAQAVTDTKLETLTAEVRKHNNFAERMPVVEQEIKDINKTVDKLQSFHMQ